MIGRASLKICIPESTSRIPDTRFPDVLIEPPLVCGPLKVQKEI